MAESGSATAAPPRLMTIAEWFAMDEDEPGELIDGRLEEEEVPDYAHEVVVAWLIRMLGAWVAPRRGLVGGSDAKFALTPRRGRKPDISVFLPGGRVPPRRGPVPIPPDIMVEVVTATPRDERRDRIEKMDDYAAFGVRYYWLVDPELRSLEVFELSAGRYTRVLAATGGKVEKIPGCEGLTLDLDDLWAEIDRLGPETTEAK